MSMIGRACGLLTQTGRTYATWNPSDKHTTVTLSNGDLTETTSADGLVRSTVGVSSGKWYWECTPQSAALCLIGVANSTAALSGACGTNVNGWAYYGGSGGLKFNNGNQGAFGIAYGSGDVVGIALDMGAGTIAFYVNNASQGTAFTGLTGTLYAASGNGTSSVLANFGATTLVYTPPSGFNAGLYQ